MHRTTRAVLVAAPLIVLAVSTAPAQAAGSGVQRFHWEGCSDFVHGYTHCYTVDGQSNLTETPSGVTSFSSRSTSVSVWSTTGGPVFQESTSDTRQHDVYQQGEPRVSTWTSTYSTSFGGTTCTTTLRFHASNGEVRVERTDASCS